MAFTGGELNELNGKMGISAPFKSVPVMKLIKVHQPKSKDALVQLIEYHKLNECKCGIKSTGTVREFGERLYNSQLTYWGNYRYSLEVCIQWEYDLFVIQSLKGGKIEKHALAKLNEALEDIKVEEASGYLDDELRVDLVLYYSENSILGGIQVKPNTFKKMRGEVAFMQEKQNSKWGYKVWMLYYNKDETFENFDQIVEDIINNLQSKYPIIKN